MSYSVRAGGTVQPGLAGSTAVVLLTSGASEAIWAALRSASPGTAWAYAQPSPGNVPTAGVACPFEFYGPTGVLLGPPQLLPVASLDDTVINAAVIVSDGSQWVLGTVAANADVVQIAGGTIPTITRAAFPVVGYVAPPSSPAATPLSYQLVATAANGEVWFSGIGVFITWKFYAGTMGTVGAVPLGVAAMVEIAGAWQWVQF